MIDAHNAFGNPNIPELMAGREMDVKPNLSAVCKQF